LKKSLFFILLLLDSLCGFSQTKSFRWEDCSEGIYDSTKFTTSQIEDTYALCYGGIQVIFDDVTFINPDKAAKLNVINLVDQYYSKLSKIRNLNIANLPFFEELKEDRINYLNHCFQARRVAILSFKNPEILREYTVIDSCEYTDIIIEGGQKMLEQWEVLWKKECKKNGNPEKCFKDHYTNLRNSPDKFFYAHQSLLGFGWWNTCANRNLYENSIKDERIWEEFQKLFIKINLEDDCD
jgi:hypothetical protein